MYLDSIYKMIKEELQKVRSSTKYFNRKFFLTFCEAVRMNKRNRDMGVDGSYVNPENPTVVLHHCYDSVYDSDFYQKNSGCYCEFLSIFCRLARDF